MNTPWLNRIIAGLAVLAVIGLAKLAIWLWSLL